MGIIKEIGTYLKLWWWALLIAGLLTLCGLRYGLLFIIAAIIIPFEGIIMYLVWKRLEEECNHCGRQGTRNCPGLSYCAGYHYVPKKKENEKEKEKKKMPTYIKVKKEDLKDLVNLYCGVCSATTTKECTHKQCAIHRYLEAIKDGSG